MKQVGSCQAKTHLAKLLAEVEHGESFIITQRGKPIAKMVPIPEAVLVWDEVIERFVQLRQAVKPGPSIREMIEEGRRF